MGGDIVTIGLLGSLSLPELIFWLFVGHSLGDFALQTDWMARFKSRHAVLPSSASKRPDLIWMHVLAAHSGIHGGLVAIVTGNWLLGLAEFVIHFAIDYFKCEGKFGFHTDQFLHLSCKVLWIVYLVW